MIRVKALAVAFGIAILLAAPNASGQPGSSVPTNLVLEVYYYPNERPAYQVVPPSNSAPSGGWYSRFRRVPGWTPAAGSHPVHAVNIKSILIGDEVRVWVSVFVGERFDEPEKDIAVYTLREGEKTSVEKLTQFGVDPFELVLVRVAPANTNLPQVISKAKSIELVTIQGNLSTLPAYRLSLRNLSSKNVVALMIRVLQDNRTQISSMPQGKEGSPLIFAGGVSEFNEEAATRASAVPGGYKPVTLPNQTIEISTAVFEDGSFEGEIEPATTFRSFVKGRKIELGLMVGLFEMALQNDRSDPSTALDRLSNDVAALEVVARPSAVQEVLNEFPSLTKTSEGPLRNTIEIAMSGIRKEAQDEIQRFRLGTSNLDSNSFHTWLVASRQRYAAWLSRL
jgi:hypothetical protein